MCHIIYFKEENVKITLLVCSFLVGISAYVQAAEYSVKKGDTIGVIAQKTGASIDQLARLNSIESPEYVVHEEDVLRYVSSKDVALARKWIEEYVAVTLDNDERVSFEKMLQSIDEDNIQYDCKKIREGICADEILLLADTQRGK